MSDSNGSSDDELEELFDSARISEKGLVKLSANEVTDKRTLLLLSTSDINALKLAVADKARLINLVNSLKPKIPVPEPKASPTPEPKASPTPDSKGPNSPDSSGTSSTVGEQPVPIVQASQSLLGQSVQGSSQVFGIAEVAAFLAGRQVPPELNAALNALPALSTRSDGQPLNVVGQQVACPTQPDLPGLFASSNGDLSQQAVRYDRHPPYLPPSVPNAMLQGYPGQFPLFMPPMLGAQSAVPTRMSTTQTLSRDQQLQHHYAGYQNSVLKDYSNINSISHLNAGEGQLFLPVNFISHIRGSGRTEDEELMKTESGASLYLSTSNTPRKIVPEKLNQGLFFGANVGGKGGTILLNIAHHLPGIILRDL
jgi:hypothetical protein